MGFVPECVFQEDSKSDAQIKLSLSQESCYHSKKYCIILILYQSGSGRQSLHVF